MLQSCSVSAFIPCWYLVSCLNITVHCLNFQLFDIKSFELPSWMLVSIRHSAHRIISKQPSETVKCHKLHIKHNIKTFYSLASPFLVMKNVAWCLRTLLKIHSTKDSTACCRFESLLFVCKLFSFGFVYHHFSLYSWRFWLQIESWMQIMVVDYNLGFSPSTCPRCK